MHFELSRYEVTWSSIKFQDLYKRTKALLLSPIFFVFGVQCRVVQCHNVYGWPGDSFDFCLI